MSGEFRDLLAQLYLSSKPSFSFERFVEHIQVAIYHSTKLPRRCQRDLEMPVEANGKFRFLEK